MTARIHDTFTEASTVPLDDHTPDIGDAWELVGQVGTQIMQVFGGAGTCGAPSNAASSGLLYAASPVMGHVDVDVAFTLAGVETAAGNRFFGVVARYSGADYDSADGYFLTLSTAANSPNVWLYRKVGITWTTLGSDTVTLAAGDTFVLECRAAGKRVLHNDVEVLSSTDDEVSGTGRVVVGVGNTMADGTNSNIRSAWRFGEFDAQTVGGMAAPTDLTVVPEGVGLRASWTSDANEFIVQRERWDGTGDP